MREAGWYWVKIKTIFGLTEWRCAYFAHYGEWLITGSEQNFTDDKMATIGPKIEQPKEQSDE